jgi:hypothetical protein
MIGTIHIESAQFDGAFMGDARWRFAAPDECIGDGRILDFCQQSHHIGVVQLGGLLR